MPPEDLTLDTVGSPVPCVEVRLVDLPGTCLLLFLVFVNNSRCLSFFLSFSLSLYLILSRRAELRHEQRSAAGRDLGAWGRGDAGLLQERPKDQRGLQGGRLVRNRRYRVRLSRQYRGRFTSAFPVKHTSRLRQRDEERPLGDHRP